MCLGVNLTYPMFIGGQNLISLTKTPQKDVRNEVNFPRAVSALKREVTDSTIQRFLYPPLPIGCGLVVEQRQTRLSW
jgi:hypothetical protein